jgi:hypothetical protein
MMKKYLYIFLVLSLTAIAGATDYTVYVDNSISDTYSGSATPDCTNYNPSTFACSGGSASAYNSLDDVDAFVASLSNGTDTATIYWRRGRTWTLTSNSDAINIDKSDTTFDAYGTGAKPIIDGDGSYPNLIGIPVIDVANNASAIGNIENVFIKNLQIVNTHDGSSTNEGGIGIRYTGTGTSEGHYIGGGGVQNCFISMTGAAAISLYRVPATDPILIESNEITRANEYHRTTSASSWPQTINTHDSYTYGHECRNNKIYNTFGEGIGCRGFDIVEYNVVSDTSSSLFYIDMMSGSGSAFSSIVRYNLGYFTNGKTHSDPGITVNDENSTGNNTAIHDQIYGNIIIGAIYGIRIRNQAVTSAFGRTDVFNNTFIDNEKNIVFAHTDYFNDVRFKNNSSIIHSDGESTCQHFSSFSVNGWTNWDIGPNFFYGTGTVALASPLTTDAVGPSGTSANLGKTSGWLSLSACPSLDDFTPQVGSDMIDNANTADLGDSYDEYLNFGEFSDLPDDPGFTIVDQDDYGDEWDFGAIIFGTDYEYFFDDEGSGTICSVGSPCAGSYAQTKLDSYSASGNTITLRFNRGATFNHASNSAFLNIDKSNVFVNAYGSGDKPKIDGGEYYPHNTGFLISIGDDSGSSVTNVHIEDIILQNTHDGESDAAGGGGIIFAGTNNSDYFTGPGSVKNCEFYNLGWGAISIYGVPNSGGSSTAIKIENCTIDRTGLYPQYSVSQSTWPSCIGNNTAFSYGHEIRNCKLTRIYGEGISAALFNVVEYNVVSGTYAGSVYWEPRNSSYTTTSNIRYNLIFRDTDAGAGTYNSTPGIHVHDETSGNGTNTSATINIYGNIVIGMDTGVEITNLDGNSHIGTVNAYGNTLIDCDSNIYTSRPQEFNNLNIKNNASIIHSDAASSCVHIRAYNTTSWSTADISNNFWHGDGWTEESDVVNFNDDALTAWRNDNVFGDANLGKTSGWRSITACPDIDDFTPQAESGMIDNSDAADLGDSYDEYIISGEFSDLPDDPDFTLADQDDYGDEWDFGAIIFGTVETPSTGGGLLAHGLSNISVHGLSDFGVHGLTTEVEPSSHPDLFASWSMENNLNDGKGSADLTAVNGPIAYESSGQLAGSYSLYLDRSSTQSAYITDANLPTGFPLKSGETNREFTAIIWFELDSLDNAQYLLGKYSTDSRRSLGILVRSLNTLQINHGKNSGAAYDVDFHGTTLSADTRYAVAYSSDASNNYRMRLYNLDTAAHIGTDLTGTWDNPISISTADLYVGGRMGSSDTLDGTVEAWIFDAELSTADMDAVILD